MQKELLDRANEINRLIENNEQAIAELEKYADEGKTLFTSNREYQFTFGHYFSVPIHFEPWEIRLMIHNKKQRLNALKAELERL